MGVDDDWDDDEHGPWCKNFEGHKPAHEFCHGHQSMWCRLCDPHGCPTCAEDPLCPDCGCHMFEDYHDWDCAYADEDIEDEMSDHQ